MASRNGKKTSGLRMLWIPGGRKSHPKGRYDSTNKHVSYPSKQKKSEVWSLGGSRNQRDFLEAEPNVSLLDGPSTSGIASLACATAAGSAAAAAGNDSKETPSSIDLNPSTQCAASTVPPNTSSETATRSNDISPTTPNSTTSTALLLSPPLSPSNALAYIDSIDSEPEDPSSHSSATMPAKSHQPVPVIVTTTTKADIIHDNRFSILGKDNNEFDIYTLPSPPNDNNLNSSSGTTASQNSSTLSPHKETETSSATSESHSHHTQPLGNGSANSSPTKKKSRHRNHNNNQGDVNSIESITEDKEIAKIPSGDLDWIDDVLQDRNDREFLANSKKKKKKKSTSAKQLDQLDGVPMKEFAQDGLAPEEDEKVVKCLYYTLMCCDCTIS